MSRRALRIEVAKKDQKELKKVLSGGVQQVRTVLRALALVQLGKGVSAPCIAESLPLTPQAIRKVGHRYEDGGLERALFEKERPGAAALLKDTERQRIIAMVCADPPEGNARWTAAGSRTGRKTADTATGRPRNHSGSASLPRAPAVAGKKCGAFRSSPMSTSRRWKMFRRLTSSLTARTNRLSVWTKSR